MANSTMSASFESIPCDWWRCQLIIDGKTHSRIGSRKLDAASSVLASIEDEPQRERAAELLKQLVEADAQ